MADPVVILGAGLGGLSAAVCLAARGVAVEVIEAAPEVGGKAGVATVDGVTFDTGPSVLTLPDALDAVFRAGGTHLEAELTLRQPEPFTRYTFPDGCALDIHNGLEPTAAGIARVLGRKAEGEFRAFMASCAAIWDIAAPAFVYGQAPSFSGMMSLGPGFGLKALTRIDPLRSMAAAIRARVREPHLRDIFLRYATYNGSDPRVAPATLNCIAHVEIALGGYGIAGGIHELPRALARVAERHGARFRLGAPVARIEADPGVKAVILDDGTRVPARAVVCNADAAHLYTTLLPKSGEPPTPASTSGWTGVFRARRGRSPRPAHHVLFPQDYDQEFVDLFDRRRPPKEPTVYLCAQETAHGRAGWTDGEIVFAMANAPALNASAGEPEDALRDRVIARLHRAGLLDPADPLVWERFPSGLAARFPGSHGALYGAASNSMFSAFRRPNNRHPRVPGLYLASGSAHPGGGMPLCVLSGRAAAVALLEDQP